MLRQLTDEEYVRKAMGVITTEVRPNVVRLIWREAVRKK
jgi:hypothetical protein